MVAINSLFFHLCRCVVRFCYYFHSLSQAVVSIFQVYFLTFASMSLEAFTLTIIL